MSIRQALRALRKFKGASLTMSLGQIERDLIGARGKSDAAAFCQKNHIDNEFLSAALTVKEVSSQIDVVIHAAGILKSLDAILEDDEIVESVSLGAGNTGRKFDLETDRRVAEYKFIDWKGGSEAIRQNGIFKDFFELAEDDTTKRKYLYVIGTNHPLKFFNGGRKIASVFGNYPNKLAYIKGKYGSGIEYVRDYYSLKMDEVSIVDVSPFIGR